MRDWLKRAVLVLVSAGFGFALVEMALRASGLAQVPVEAKIPYPQSYYARDDAAGFDIVERFPAAEFRLMDYAHRYGTFFKVWSNELGCFDTHQESGRGAVFLVGDSFTWGYVPFEATWGTLVEREVGGRVVKCGVGGYGTRQARLKVEKLVRRIGPPAVIVLGYFIGNDVIDDYLFPQLTVSDGYLVSRVSLANEATGARRVLTEAEAQARASAAAHHQPRGFEHVKQFFARHSVSYNLLREDVHVRMAMWRMGLAEPPPLSPVPLAFRPADRYLWLEGAWTTHLDNLRNLRRLALDLGAELVVVVIPSREQVYDFLRPQDKTAQWEQPNSRLRAFLGAERIRSLDLLEELRARARQTRRRELDLESDLYWRYDPHLNVAGNRVAGLLVSRYLLEHRLVDPVDRQQRLARVERELGLRPPSP
jgi:hypothetical protein